MWSCVKGGNGSVQRRQSQILLSGVQERTTGNGHKLEHRKFHVSVKTPDRPAGHGNSFPWKAVEPPSMGIPIQNPPEHGPGGTVGWWMMAWGFQSRGSFQPQPHSASLKFTGSQKHVLSAPHLSENSRNCAVCSSLLNLFLRALHEKSTALKLSCNLQLLFCF